MEAVLMQALQTRLRYWEDQLAQAALDNDNARARLCECIIAEYTTLSEIGFTAVPVDD